ncbi:MAG TPA: nitroreductase/quinone reductase family protein [Solirubrobacteraceae bacterium]|nr:nitroreductase/quinone reductase family protein [Solirubrobacteraceae bacterium]
MAGAIPHVDPEAISSSRFKRAVFAFALTGVGTWYSSKVGARIDPWLLRASRGRVDSAFGQIPIVLVDVRGARSGVERTVPLLYFNDGDDVILIASSYGRPNFPAWYYNLKANPDVRLEAMGRSGRYTAHEATGEDRDRLFELAKKVYRGYSDYERRTTGIRRIPVMRLAPA